MAFVAGELAATIEVCCAAQNTVVNNFATVARAVAAAAAAVNVKVLAAADRNSVARLWIAATPSSVSVILAER